MADIPDSIVLKRDRDLDGRRREIWIRRGILALLAAFLAAVRALDRFDRRRPFGPWLHRIVVNRAIDWARARTLRRELDVESVAQPVASEPDRVEALTTVLSELGPEQRAVVVLRYLLEYTPGEIAELLELPRGTVNSRLRRGLDRLEEALRRE